MPAEFYLIIRLKNSSSDFPRAMHVWAPHFLAQSARLGIELVLQNQANNNVFLPSFRWRVEISSKLVLFRVRSTSRWLHVWILTKRGIPWLLARLFVMPTRGARVTSLGCLCSYKPFNNHSAQTRGNIIAVNATLWKTPGKINQK